MSPKIASPTLQCSQQVLPQSFASPKPTSPFHSSSSLAKCSRRNSNILCRLVVVSGTWPSKKLLKSISRGHTMKRACSTVNFDEFFHEDDEEEEDQEQIYQVFKSFELSGDEEDQEEYSSNNNTTTCTTPPIISRSEQRSNMSSFKGNSLLPSKLECLDPFMLGIQPEPPEWPEREEIIRASIERRVNSIDLPLSLRMIKKKQKWQEGFGGFGESACCSVKKAFSSILFIILELQRCALKMRELMISCGDLEGIVARAHREMQSSFVWLFQQVFSQTPSLMIHVMILLADFSVYSMVLHNTAIQDHSLLGTLCEATEKVLTTKSKNQQQFDSSLLKMKNQSVVDIPRFSLNEDQKIDEKDAGLWSLVVEEAIRMQQVESRGAVVDHDTMQSFVSPVSVELEPDDYMDYYRTDLLYQMGLSQDPNNSLLLCNYAQFLHLVAHDYDRAEECFKRAIQVEPFDAEALSQYGTFLWLVRKDPWGAEERYLQALAAEPENPFHVSKYANFLWSTGGEETCFPLNTTTYNQNNSKA